MTENERFDSVFDRIQAAKTREAYRTWPAIRLRVSWAEKLLSAANLKMAEAEIAKAEDSMLYDEIKTIALKQGMDVYLRILEFLGTKRYDKAMEILFA